MAYNAKTEKIKKANIKQLSKNELTVNQDPVSNMPSSATPCNENHLDRKNVLKNLEKKRRLKMNILLAFIAIIFAASWLPLNIFNILSDSKNSIIKADHTFYIVNAVCILFAMSSAVSNPFLYGFLNENFKREYVRLFRKIVIKLFCFSNNQKQGEEDVNNEISLKYQENRLKVSDVKAQKSANESRLLRYDVQKL